MEVLASPNANIDDSFKISLIQDLCNGLHYFHTSWLGSHGRLHSNNCLVDGRWLLKLTDYAIPHLMTRVQRTEGYDAHRAKWWTAPEVLRTKENSSVPVTTSARQKSDIYSLSIVLYEITYRDDPYPTDKAPRTHVTRVHDGETPPYRPSLSEAPFHESLRPLIEQCWAESANERPDIHHVIRIVKKLSGGKKLNIMDHVMNMLEKHTMHLEELVAEQTADLMVEKRKTDSLLNKMLPPSVVEKLKMGDPVHAESYDDVTIYFSDIESFTKISSGSTPMQVVTLLNALYTMFDHCLDDRDVYKVETIGDAYMVVSGLPTRNGNRHAGEIAGLALDLLSSVLVFEIPHMTDVQLRIRIGLHTGPCCAGVVGVAMPRYCLFGDSVNIASKMESTGVGLRIHVSPSTHAILVDLGGYFLEKRREEVIKDYITYWLNDREGRVGQFPSYDQLHPKLRPDGLAVRCPPVRSPIASSSDMGEVTLHVPGKDRATQASGYIG